MGRGDLNSLTKRSVNPLSEYYEDDNPFNIIDDQASYIDNILTIDTKNLSYSRLPSQPWSSSYWPLYQGSITYRYLDPNVPNSNNFNDYDKYILQQRRAQTLIDEGKVDLLSPAEKYDFLMNDKNFTLTNSIIKDIRKYGKFEGWEGICHGWAPVSYMYKRPVRSVIVSNAEGKQVTFKPDDIKALNSLLWANLNYQTKFVGNRCNIKDPKKDVNGRIIDQGCFDTNPGAFHLALVNQIGINKRSFVFDASYDYTVWNQPIVAYSYSYFNPQTGFKANDSRKAMVSKNEYTKDKFKNYRSENAVYIVGVKSRIEYLAETWPDGKDTDSPRKDKVISVEYIYDLEIDASGKIIGGEWYQNAHPDFLWTAVKNADVSTNVVPRPTATTNYNFLHMYYNYYWDENPRSPAPEWTQYSVYSSQNYRVPLENIVRNLTAWSSVNNNEQETPENCKQPCIPNIYKWHNY